MHQKPRLIFLVCAIGVGLFVSLVVHELGHSAACSYFGYDSQITLNLLESHVYCESADMDLTFVPIEGSTPVRTTFNITGTDTELTFIRLAGGGTAAAMFLLALIPNFVRRNDYVRLALLAGGITNLINAFIETLVPEQYGVIYVTIPGLDETLLWPTIILITGFCATIMVEWCLFKREIKKR